MIDELRTRIASREFLSKYPSDRWQEVIADVIEIGVLNMKNSFGKEEFSKGEIKAVLNDLRHYTPNSQSFPTYTSYQNEEYKRIKESQYYNPLTRTMGFRKDEPI